MKPRRPSRGPSPQLLVALWAAGIILFNFPMLIVFDRDATVLGLPVLPVALFSIWAMLIAALAWAMERGPPESDSREGGDRPAPGAPSVARGDSAQTVTESLSE